MKDDRRILTLIKKHLQDELTLQESKELEEWAASHPSNKMLFERLQNSDQLLEDMLQVHTAKERNWKQITRKIAATKQGSALAAIPAVEGRSTKVIKFHWIIRAAIVVGLVGVTLLAVWLLTRPPVVQVQPTEDVYGARYAGFLELGDGSKLEFNNLPPGKKIKQDGIEATTTDSGWAYKAGKNGGMTPVYNTFTTPVAGQINLEFADSSKVWVNAASSLQFPVAFTGGARRVKLTGEAYFNINRDTAKPFIVTTNFKDANKEQVEVEVLGTRFNVNAYDDDSIMMVSVLEGSVAVNTKVDKQILTNRQVAEVDKTGHIKVSEMSDTLVASWTNHEFVFEKAGIEQIMKQVARWYGVKVNYKGGKITELFNMAIDRDKPLSTFLDALNETGTLVYTIKDSTVTIMPKVNPR